MNNDYIVDTGLICSISINILHGTALYMRDSCEPAFVERRGTSIRASGINPLRENLR